jgi:hypothetical protein
VTAWPALAEESTGGKSLVRAGDVVEQWTLEESQKDQDREG